MATASKPGGEIYLLFEPSCPRYLQPLYDRHVRREEVKERYYSVGEYRRMVARAGLRLRHCNYTSFLHRRSRRAVLYYVALSALPGTIRTALPCSQVMVGRKAG